MPEVVIACAYVDTYVAPFSRFPILSFVLHMHRPAYVASENQAFKPRLHGRFLAATLHMISSFER